MEFIVRRDHSMNMGLARLEMKRKDGVAAKTKRAHKRAEHLHGTQVINRGMGVSK